MAFAVQFGKSNKKVNSTLQPTGNLSVEVACELKERTSVENPTFVIQKVLGSGWQTWNYCRCDTFGRYYFINDIAYVEGRIEVSCRCDYLASYKTEILASEVYVSRSASSAVANHSITDVKFPTSATPTISQTAAGLPTSSTGTIMCCIIGKSGNAFLAVHPLTFKNVVAYLYSTDYLDGLNTLLETPKDVQKEIARPQDYLQSAIWLPFNISGTPTQISLGYIDTSWAGDDVGTGEVLTFTRSLAIPRPSDSDTFKYMSVEPFTRYVLTLPFIGTVPIPAQEIWNVESISVKYSIDINGGIFCTVSAGGNVLFTATGNCGSPVSYSSRTTNNIGTLSTAISTAASAAMQNWFGVAQGVISGISNIMPTVESSGGSGGTMIGDNTIRLRAIMYSQPNRDSVHAGFPVCKSMSLNGLSGYTLCENASVECDATEQGKATINDFLNGGFYIE